MMSLEDFKTEEPQKGPQKNERKPFIDGGKVVKTVKGAVKAFKKLKEIDDFEGYPTVQQWDEYRSEINISTAARSLKRNCGKTLGDISIHVQGERVKKSNSMTRYDVDISLLKAAKKYGPAFGTKQLNEDSNLISETSITRITGDSFNGRKKKLDLKIVNPRNITVKTIKEEVDNLVDETGYPITQSKIDKHCSFSNRLITRIGEGSFVNGVNSLGFKTLDVQDNSRDSSGLEYYELLTQIDSYDTDADHYIYVLKLSSDKINQTVMYVGETNCLGRRIGQHKREGGNFKSHIKTDDGIIKISKLDFSVEIENIDSIYNVSKTEAQCLERRKQNAVCRDYKDAIVLGA